MICEDMLLNVLFIGEDINVDQITDERGTYVPVIRLRGGGSRRGRSMTSYAQSKLRKLGSRLISSTIDRGLGLAESMGQKTLDTIMDTAQAAAAKMPSVLCKIAPQRSYKKAYNVMKFVRSIKDKKIYFTMHHYHGSAWPLVFNNVYAATSTPYPTSGTGFFYSRREGLGPGLYSETCSVEGLAGTYGDNELCYGNVVDPRYLPSTGNVTVAGTARVFNAAGMYNNANTMYFMANYPWNSFLPDPTTQDSTKSENYLSWIANQSTATTDPNFPVLYSDIVGNKDWTKIVILGTQLDFNFTNYNPMPMCVEVLLFKFIADFDDFSLVGNQENCVFSNFDRYDSYCRDRITSFGTSQIEVIQRDRFVLSACKYTVSATDNTRYYHTGVVNSNKSVVHKSYILKQKYSVNRSITKTSEATTPTEPSFMNFLIDRQKAIYCRVAAWQIDGLVTSNVAVNLTADEGQGTYVTYGPMKQQKGINASMLPLTYITGAAALPENIVNTQNVGRPLVDFNATKRTWITMDTDYYRSYTKVA